MQASVIIVSHEIFLSDTLKYEVHYFSRLQVSILFTYPQSLEPACLGEETAVNKYNMAALLTEKSAAIGISTEEAREVERLFEDVVRIWAQQHDNGSMRCINRINIRRISYHLKTSRPKFPDLK